MFTIRNLLILSFVMVACHANCPAYEYYEDYASDYIRRSQRQTDINLQHSMMQSQVNAMYDRPQYTPAPSRQYNVEDRPERPTYVIEKPLYKFGE